MPMARLATQDHQFQSMSEDHFLYDLVHASSISNSFGVCLWYCPLKQNRRIHRHTLWHLVQRLTANRLSVMPKAFCNVTALSEALYSTTLHIIQ